MVSIAPATVESHPNNLSVERSPIIGREKELAAAAGMLLRDDVGLVTLTGPGGTGKTRLALQLAHNLLGGFEDGVFFVNLAPIVDSGLVATQIAQTLGVQEAAGQPLSETLKNYLQDKQMLLVLDNFEQVVEAAPLVGELLSPAPGLKILVTSRTTLHLRAEKEFSVPPLQLPDLKHLPPLESLTQYEAVRLFIERALDTKRDFQVTNENAPAVAEICHRLDGLPLAIELAAARIKILSPQAILARLQSHVLSGAEGRMKLLTGGARDLPARQQTLRNTIEWSYDLLDEGEKKLFRRLAVFVGGCSLEATETMCNAEGDLDIEVLTGVSSLADKSLLRQEEGVDGEPHFVMLETIHEHAREKLQESREADTIKRHHALFFLAMAEEGEPHLRGPRQPEWLDRLEEQLDNLRAALEWSFRDKDRAEIGLRLAGALLYFWDTHGNLTEGRRWLERMLVQGVHAAPRWRAKALHGAGFLAWLQSDYERAAVLNREAVELYRELGDKQGVAHALNVLGILAGARGDYVQAQLLNEESLALFREAKDKWGIALATTALGNLAGEQEDYVAARMLLEDSLAIMRELGDKVGTAHTLNVLGEVARSQGDYPTALSLYEESLVISRGVGHRVMVAYLLHNLGHVLQGLGDYRRSAALLLESLASLRELENKAAIDSDLSGLAGGSLIGLAGIVGAYGQPEQAARLVGSASASLQAINARDSLVDHKDYARIVATLRAQLDEAVWTRAWVEGQVMTLEQAVEYALEIVPALEKMAAEVQPELTPPQDHIASYPAGLTEREVEVLRLVAKGHTNDQIAKEMLISTHTVSFHLRSIYGKLNVPSRAAAARFAVEHGLV